MFLSSRAGQSFVVRFDDAAREQGRAEHIASGKKIDFGSVAQLMDFLRTTGSTTGRSLGAPHKAASGAAGIATAKPRDEH
jgi:hypothetical protein